MAAGALLWETLFVNYLVNWGRRRRLFLMLVDGGVLLNGRTRPPACSCPTAKLALRRALFSRQGHHQLQDRLNNNHRTTAGCGGLGEGRLQGSVAPAPRHGNDTFTLKQIFPSRSQSSHVYGTKSHLKARAVRWVTPGVAARVDNTQLSSASTAVKRKLAALGANIETRNGF